MALSDIPIQIPMKLCVEGQLFDSELPQLWFELLFWQTTKSFSFFQQMLVLKSLKSNNHCL